MMKSIKRNRAKEYGLLNTNVSIPTPKCKPPKEPTLEEYEMLEYQLKTVLLQIQCLHTLGRDVPAQLMDELETLYSVIFEG